MLNVDANVFTFFMVLFLEGESSPVCGSEDV